MKTIQTTPEEEKAMSYVAVDPQAWIQNAWNNRARQGMLQIIQDTTNLQPKKLTQAEVINTVKKAQVKTAKQRHEETIANVP